MAKKARVWNGSSWQDLASAVTDLSSYANLSTTPISGFRNAIINGGFDIDQRNSGTLTGPAGTYGLDRWLCVGYESGTNTFAPVSFALGGAPEGAYSKKFLRITSSGQSGINARTEIRQNIENVSTFSGQTITISFWAKADSGTPKVAVAWWQNFGTGGSPSASNTKAIGAVTLSNAWAKYSVTTTVDSVSGKILGTGNNDFCGPRIFTNAGTTYNSVASSIGVQNATIDIWGVQVERGTIATPFEQRPIGTELDLCKRYYQTFGGNAVGTTIAVGFADAAGTAGGLFRNLSPTMRVAPASGFFGTIFITDFIVYRPLTALTSDRNTIDTFYSTPSYSGGTLNATRPAFAYSTGGFITLNAEL
jgi:hypothetical protein